MRITDLFKRAFLSGSLLTGAPAMAHAQPQPPAPIEIYGSARTLAMTHPFKETLRRLAGTSMLIYGRHDLINGTQDTTDISEQIERMRRFLEPFAASLPYLLERPARDVETTQRPVIRGHLLLERFLNATRDHASAHIMRDPVTNKVFCEITMPDAQEMPEAFFRSLSGLPSGTPIKLPSHIRPQDIFTYILFHEAAHCGQPELAHQHPSDYERIHHEADADEKGLMALRAHLRGTQSDAYIKDFIDYIHAGRSMGALRHGTNIFAPDFDLPTHAGAPFGMSRDFPPNGENHFEYDSTDVALATIIISTLSNVIAGSFYGVTRDPQQSRSLNANSRLGQHNPFAAPASLEQTIRNGRLINDFKPEIQLSIFRHLHASLSALEPDHAHRPFEYRLWAVTQQMLKNYINAADRYAPSLSSGAPITPPHYFSRLIYDAFFTELPTMVRSLPVTFKPDTQTVDVIEALKVLRNTGAFKEWETAIPTLIRGLVAAGSLRALSAPNLPPVLTPQ